MQHLAGDYSWRDKRQENNVYGCACAGVFTNVALDGDVELTIPGDFVGSGTPEKVTNGETGLGTGWISKNTSTGGHGLTVDFGDLFFINEVTLISGTARGENVGQIFPASRIHRN